MKRFVRAFITNLPGIGRWIPYLGPKLAVQIFITQRILRINSSTPWPAHWTSRVSHPERIKKASVRPLLGASIGCYIQARNGIEVGAGTRVGPGVKIISSNHDIGDLEADVKSPPIKIGANCWLGANSVLLPGVILGDRTIVGAGAVVTKSFPEGYCVLGGVPAKVIKHLDPSTGSADTA